MSEEISNASAVSAESAPAAPEPVSDRPAVLESADDIAAALGEMDERGVDAGTQGQPDSSEAAPAAAAPEDGAAEGAAGADAPAYVPEGWDNDVWDSVPENAREFVRQREAAHAEELKARIAKEEQTRASALALQQAANAQCGEAQALMRSIVEAEYGGIDWDALKASDPKAYVELQDRFRQRIEGINALQAKIGESARAMRELNARKAQAEIDAEAAKTIPVISALIGQGFDPKRHAKDLTAYMTEHGVPAEAQNGMTRGYELEFVTKAMLYDRQAKARAEAAKKVAEAPKVSAPKNGERGENQAFTRARERLRSHSGSTEALAALLGTM